MKEDMKEKIKDDGDSVEKENFALPALPSSEQSPTSRMTSFDAIEQKSTGQQRWQIGMWKQRRSRSPKKDLAREEYRYHGGLMKPDPESQKQPSPSHAKSPRKSRFFGKKSKKSLDSTRSSDNDTISNFSSSEWTPADSAYGAACPVGGCIPKHFRRMVEFSLIAGMFIGFIYLLVRTSVHLTNGKQNTFSNSTEYISGQIALDDDLYAAYNVNDDAYNNETYDDDGQRWMV
jgi:hypothetical protein